jgi:hypothetical protein
MYLYCRSSDVETDDHLEELYTDALVTLDETEMTAEKYQRI